MSTSTPITGASISRADLLSRARVSPFLTGQTPQMRETYLSAFDSYAGATLGDVKATADRKATEAKEATRASLAKFAVGTVAGIAGLAVLAQPIGCPIMHGLALCAEVGSFIFAGYQFVQAIKAGGQQTTAKFMSATTAAYGDLMVAEKTGAGTAALQPSVSTAVSESKPAATEFAGAK